MGDTETKLNNTLRSGLRGVDPYLQWIRVENWTGRGVPDVHYLAHHPGQKPVAGWIELKITDGLQVDLRPEQVGWLTSYTRAGGAAWVASRKANQIKFWPGSEAREVRDQGWTRPPALLLEKPYNYRGLMQLLNLQK